MKRKNKWLSLAVIICILVTSVFSNIFFTQTVAYAKTKKSVKSLSIKIGKKNVTKKTVTLAQGKTAKLKVTTKPTKAKNNVKFSTSNKKIATVSKAGKIKAKKAGIAKIKVVISGKYQKKTTWVKIKVIKADSEQPSATDTPSQSSEEPSATDIPSQPSEEPTVTDTPSQPSEEPSQESKVLIAYFSRTGENYDVGVIEKGNTAIIADMIAKQTGGTEFEIVTVNPYPDGYDECKEVVQREREQNARPELKGDLPALDAYDTIFIGYPIWYADMPMAVYTFLESYDWSGKTVIPFCTHAGSALSGTEASIQQICTGADVKGGLAIRGSVAQNDREEAKNSVTIWLNGLGF